MRAVIAVVAALVLAACDASVDTGSSGDNAAAPDGYTMVIRATGQEQTYLITAPDGRTVGARAAEGASALMDGARAQTLIGEPPPRMEEVPEVMSLRLPGFEMSVGGTEGEGGDDNGQVKLSMGEGRQRIEVHADEGGPGEADDRAFVRITGADEEAVREFVADAEELSPEVRTQMLSGLGLQ
ncbi:MAG: hypothetical protein ACREH4_15590 [Vitreimonas sp.]